MNDRVPRASTTADLPDISEIAPGYSSAGYPEEFSELFVDSRVRLLRAGRGRVIAFRNEDLRKLAANPGAGNMPFEALMKRSFIEGAQDTQVGIENRPSAKRFLIDQIFTANPPRHSLQRQVLARSIMPRSVQSLAAIAEPIVEGLIDELAGSGEFDLASAFAEPLAGRFWEQAYSLTGEERQRTMAAVRAMAPLFYVTRTPDEIASLEVALGEYMDALGGAVERSIRAGGNALLQSMKTQFDALDIEGKPRHFGDWVATNVIDGVHTAAVACVNVLYCLLRAPAALAAARADAGLLHGVLAEGLRMLAPVIVTNRFALQDFDYEGTRIAAGTAIAMIWAAGNRDPAVFEDPNSYNLRRNQRTPMTFGGGVHICPGRYVGSMLSSVALKALINPRVEIALCGESPHWQARSFMRIADRVTVTVRRVAKR
jgi:cytochrome P450